MLTTVVAGISHKVAPVEVRELLAPGAKGLPEALDLLRGHALQGAILSTCNRTEVYAALPDGGGPEPLVDFLCSYRDSGRQAIEPYLYTYTGPEAMRHLFRVAASLDSMVLGEAQILGQVRVAADEARAHRATGPHLDRLFRHAVRVGRRARDETAVGRRSASVSSAGVELARQFFGSLEGLSVLVVSAGEAGKLVARALQDVGIARVTVTSRTFERAASLADSLGGEAVPFERLESALAAADIVITASGSPSFIVRPSLVARAMATRAGQPLLLVDIAVPRDVDPTVVRIPGVALYNVDDLQAVTRSSLKQRGQEVGRVEAIVEEELDRFLVWWRAMDATPTIVDIRGQAEAIRRRELSKAIRKLPSLGEADQAVLEAMSRSIVKKLLHRPITSLKERASDPGYLESARRLFRLTDGQDSDGPS